MEDGQVNKAPRGGSKPRMPGLSFTVRGGSSDRLEAQPIPLLGAARLRASRRAAPAPSVARKYTAVALQGGRAESCLTMTPSASRKATSMGMRMKKVWMELQGSMCSPSPKGSAARPISPMNRSTKLVARWARSASRRSRVHVVHPQAHVARFYPMLEPLAQPLPPRPGRPADSPQHRQRGPAVRRHRLPAHPRRAARASPSPTATSSAPGSTTGTRSS